MALSRRSFLSRTGVHASALLSGLSLNIPGLRAAGKKYSGCILGRTGAGDYGHGLDIIFNGMDNVAVNAVADENAAGRKQAAERSGAVRQYADYREMLEKENPDIVSIGPRQPDCHREMCLACIEAGAHIYMEKPIT